MNIRENTYDYIIVKEVVERGDYNRMTLNKDDIVLDLGAHIGAYTCLIAPSVKQVIAYEPEPSNFKLLKQNISGLNNVTIHNEAVVPHANGKIPFYVPKSLNTGIGSIIKRKGRKEIFVDTVSFKDILDEYKPTKIKCDIEGAEYDIFAPPLKIPVTVKEIIMEVHVQGHRTEKYVPPNKQKTLFGNVIERIPFKKYENMEQYLKSQGFNDIQPDRDTFLKTKGWQWVVLYKRKKEVLK